MLTFSLVVATVGRTKELDTLFHSLAEQAYPQLECIVVDQNADDRVERIVNRWRSALPLRRVTSTAGLSHSRNVGLALAKGNIVAFPDDDCWYTESLLRNVSNWFENHPEFSILTVGARDLCDISSGNRWIQDRCEIRPANAFRTTFSSTIFVRRQSGINSVQFDESLGVGSGTPYSCGEETDYILNLLGEGARGYFDRTWHIGHPKRDMLSGQVTRQRAAGYGRGMGHVLRKHALPSLGAGFVAYDVLRAAVSALRGNGTSAGLCLRHAWGVATGYMAPLSYSSPIGPISSSQSSERLSTLLGQFVAPSPESLKT